MIKMSVSFKSSPLKEKLREIIKGLWSRCGRCSGVGGCGRMFRCLLLGAPGDQGNPIRTGVHRQRTGPFSPLGAEFSPGPPFRFALAGYQAFPDLVKPLETGTWRFLATNENARPQLGFLFGR